VWVEFVRIDHGLGLGTWYFDIPTFFGVDVQGKGGMAIDVSIQDWVVYVHFHVNDIG
jgi:hypothetical protein